MIREKCHLIRRVLVISSFFFKGVQCINNEIQVHFQLVPEYRNLSYITKYIFWYRVSEKLDWNKSNIHVSLKTNTNDI